MGAVHGQTVLSAGSCKGSEKWPMHPEPTKVFVILSQETALLFAPFWCIHPPPPVPPKRIVGSDPHKIKVSCWIYPAISRKGLNCWGCSRYIWSYYWFKLEHSPYELVVAVAHGGISACESPINVRVQWKFTVVGTKNYFLTSMWRPSLDPPLLPWDFVETQVWFGMLMSARFW